MSTISARHLRVGFWGLCVFAGLGLGLEALHGLKLGFYLDVSNETRRLMWRLGHAHGTLLSLLNIAFALSLSAGHLKLAHERLVSNFLLASTLLLPFGFLLAGIYIHAGDPGLAVVLVPFGAVLLLAALGLIAKGVR